MANDLIGKPLDALEQHDLEQCEAVIERGSAVFLEVGNALKQIQEGKLYRDRHKTFEEYCKSKWGIERRRAYFLIEAAGVVENVINLSQTSPPKVESQARALSSLEPEQQAAAWQDAVDKAAEQGEPVTAAIVAEVVQSYQDDAEPYQEPEDDPPPKKKAEKVKDANGKTVPEHLIEVFQRAKEFDAVLNLSTQLRKGINVLAKDELLGTFLAAKGVAATALRDLENVRHAVKFAKPHAICPYCKTRGCDACYQTGWVGERINASAPKN